MMEFSVCMMLLFIVRFVFIILYFFLIINEFEINLNLLECMIKV